MVYSSVIKDLPFQKYCQAYFTSDSKIEFYGTMYGICDHFLQAKLQNAGTGLFIFLRKKNKKGKELIETFTIAIQLHKESLH